MSTIDFDQTGIVQERHEEKTISEERYMIWLISDTHFGHDKKFIYGPRGFGSVQEADRVIIRNWNDAIGEEDEVYMLGDFFLGLWVRSLRIERYDLKW